MIPYVLSDVEDCTTVTKQSLALFIKRWNIFVPLLIILLFAIQPLRVFLSQKCALPLFCQKYTFYLDKTCQKAS